MRFDVDTYREILDTLTRNKSRSFLTGFGVFWGVFMLVSLIGGGQGLKEMLNKNFEGFATNSAFVWSQQTSKAYKGFRKGRWWSMDLKDVERLRQRVPELDVIAPVVFMPWNTSGTAYYEDRKVSINVQGVTPEYALVNGPKLYYGRFINDMDLKQHRKVCVLGKKIYKDLFKGGGNPCGKSIRIDSTYYQVVGVDYNTSNISINGRSEEMVTLPFTMVQQAYNRGHQIDLIAVTARKGVVMSDLTDRIRETVARAHYVDPTDEKGTTVTTEIGIRRAIGATPKMILSQIISESIVLTLVAGMSGILFGVLVLQMLELGNTEDGIVTTHFQIGFWTAIFAALVVSTLGVLAGLAPAARAMSIKPVDAMRDE